MRPEIESYLRDMGGRYTTKALRAQLVKVGHDPAEVDAALAETEAARAPRLAANREEGSRFWRWTLLINLVVLVVTTVLVAGSTYGGLTFIVLGIAMLLALLVTGNVGRALVRRSGFVVALAVPTVGALLLGGWCYSMMRGGVPI